MPRIGRNDPCPCGSGKKYKKCCMGRDQAQAEQPRIMTASGEPMSWHQARYTVLDPVQVLDLLDQAPDFDRDQPDANQPQEIGYAWLETGESALLMKRIKGIKPPLNPLMSSIKGEDPQRLLGNLTIKGDKLIFNAMGEQRFALGKERLEALLEGTVKHRLDSRQSMTSALAQASLGNAGLLANPLSPPPKNFDPSDPLFAPLAPGESLVDALRNRDFVDLEQANLFTQMATDAYNHEPQAELGGLSPLQMVRLLHDDWEDSQGTLALNRELTVEDLKNRGLLLVLAHALLVSCGQGGGIRATKSGYMDPTFVRALTANLIAENDEELEAIAAKLGKSYKELDLWPLHVARVLCQLGGLLKEENKRFNLTKKGQTLSDTSQLGRLYTRLFLTQFTLVELDALDPAHQEYPCIQETIAFSFYMLRKKDSSRWYRYRDLLPDLMAPVVKLEVGGNQDPALWDEESWQRALGAMDCRLVSPLLQFGLLEEREQEADPDDQWEFELRPTPLLAKFITINF